MFLKVFWSTKMISGLLTSVVVFYRSLVLSCKRLFCIIYLSLRFSLGSFYLLLIMLLDSYQSG